MASDDTPIEIGKVGRPHGVRGELRIFTDAESDTLGSVEAVVLEHPGDGSRRDYRVRRAKSGQRFWIVSLEGVQDRNAAAELVGASVWVNRTQLPEPDEDEFYACDLVGLRVITCADDGAESELGTVQDVFDNGAHDVLVVDVSEGAEELVPFVNDFVIGIDLDAGELRVRPIEYE